MEEGGLEATVSKQEKKTIVCEECKKEPSKYTCPGCHLRTCSLPCVKSHKQRTACLGKRDSTQFVPLSQFDDNLLLSDYLLLEDVRRIADSAQRARVKLCGYPKFKLPKHLKSLQNVATKRKTRLWLLPSGMAKREKNQTRYNQRTKSIFWTIEWRFHSTDIVLVDHGVHESTNLSSVIEKHLQPSPWSNKLREFCEEELDTLRFFIQKYPKGTKSPFRELDVKLPLSHLLSNMVILEYPVILVFLPSHKCNFEIIRDLGPMPVEPQPKERKRDDLPTHKGVQFKEEEIMEDENCETEVLDLRETKLESHPTNNDFMEEGRILLKESEPTGGEFEFDKDLMDIYSFLMEESNPDDLLKFKLDGEESKDPSIVGGVLDVEDLEEGEIPSSD